MWCTDRSRPAGLRVETAAQPGRSGQVGRGESIRLVSVTAISSPLPDAFASHLGIEVERDGGGDRVTARATVGGDHLNPHGGAHGAFIYALAGAALAALANDETRSGMVSSVHIDYLRPAGPGDDLVATATIAELLDRGHIYSVSIVNRTNGTVIAMAGARATTRPRSAS